MNAGFAETGRHLVLYLVTIILSLTVHEFAHAFVADRLGDDTPRRQGRLTLSPLAHADPVGTLLFPAISILGFGFALFGWARPVETNPSRYTRRMSARNGHRLVAAAGPMSNLVLATLCMAGIAIMVRVHPSMSALSGTARAALTLLATMVQVNVGLCVFNFLPIPPLDGSRLLPRSLDTVQAVIAPYSFLILMLVLNVPVLSQLFFWPVRLLNAALQALFGLDVGLA